jgi:hypothetical protein
VLQVLSALARESSRYVQAESADVVLGRLCNGEKRICSPGSARRKRTSRVGSSAVSTEIKRRRRKLRRLYDLELEANSTTPNLGDDVVNVDLEDDVESWGGVSASRYVLKEEDQEDVPSFVHRNRRSKASNDVPDQALLGLVSLQGMTMSVIDNVLEEVIPEDILLELSETGADDVRIESPDVAPSASFLVGQEATQPACRVSPAPEGALVYEDASAPEGAAEYDPAPEGPGTDSPSAVAMGSGLPVSPTGLATLDAGGPSTEDPMGAPGAEIPLGVALSMDYNLPLVSNPTPDTTSVSAFPSDSISIPSALGFPLFLSNLQVHASLLFSTLISGCFLVDFYIYKVFWTRYRLS